MSRFIRGHSLCNIACTKQCGSGRGGGFASPYDIGEGTEAEQAVDDRINVVHRARFSEQGADVHVETQQRRYADERQDRSAPEGGLGFAGYGAHDAFGKKEDAQELQHDVAQFRGGSAEAVDIGGALWGEEIPEAVAKVRDHGEREKRADVHG